MTTDEFALWKFKTTEGVLENFSPGDFTTTNFTKGFEMYTIKYDLAHCTCTISNLAKLDADIITVPFSELVNKLKEMGVYKERPASTRHSSSYIPYTGRLS